LLLFGNQIANEIIEKVKKKVVALHKYFHCYPKLAIIIVGNDYATNIYVKAKIRACHKVNIEIVQFRFEKNVSQKKILSCINELNCRDEINGILVQLPLPNKLDRNLILQSISPIKDVDGLHPNNLGLLFNNDPKAIVPCAVKGIMKLLENYQFELEGKNCVVINNSIMIGKPLTSILLNRKSTVTLVNAHTHHLSEITKKADFIFCAVGIKDFLTEQMVSKKNIVIDIGTQFDKITQKTIGDASCKIALKVKAITPVPGGIGPITVTMLLVNLIDLFEKQNSCKK
jgi:methylenetetrahydrofolate dehydrogenase (NADP+)/methenyltetrahydrofolate cyclohydrolase